MAVSTLTPSPLPWADGVYSIKRHGVTITNCDSEPVQTPGCVQAHGALLVLRPGDLTIAQVSENIADLLGQPPATLLDAALTSVIGEAPTTMLRGLLASGRLEHNPLRIDTLPPLADRPALELIAHTCDGVVLLELEPCLATNVDEVHHVHDDYADVASAFHQIRSADGLQALHDTTAAELRRLTGLDRVMIYKFHADDHGEVVAESRRDDLPPWLGLHYPAEDIPKPARDIFKELWIRPVPDISGGLAELVPLAHPDTGRPTTLTYCVLRGPSVMYTEYLHNMGVRAALTLPIRRDEQLWGLIAGHHYTGTRHFSFETRAACQLVAQVVSLQQSAAVEREALVYRLKLDGIHQLLIARAAHSGNLETLVATPGSLLDGLDAGGAAVRHRDLWSTVGAAPSPAQLDALTDWLFTREEFIGPARVYASDQLARDYPPAAAFTDRAAGLLAIPLSRARRSLVLWFRPETLQTVTWAGSPHDKPTVVGPHGPRLTPRVSFEMFVESVRDRSSPWTPAEVEAAMRLRLLIMELVISRADQVEALNKELGRSNDELKGFAHIASHDLKEPLRGIHKHVSQLQSQGDSLSADGHHRLDVIARLAVRMDSLIESLLQFSHVGRSAPRYEDVELAEVFAEAVEMVSGRLSERQAEITVARPLPRLRCDRVRVRKSLVNLLANALKYTDRDTPHIEIGWLAADEAAARTTVPPGNEGQRVFYLRDDGIGIAPRHHEKVFEMFRRLHGHDQYGGGTGAGLAIVRKMIESHRGHIWIDSQAGAGTTFYFTLPGTNEAES